MPYYTEGPLGADASLYDLPSSTGAASGAAFDEAIAGNPTAVAWNWMKLRRANAGQKLSNDDAADRITAAGVNLEVPQGGLTQEALDILIERKRDEAARQTALARAPSGFVAGTARVASSLGGAIIDPINIAAAFVPVVGEARYGQLLAGAGSAIGRLGVRAAVGAAEGAVGAAIVEPFIYAGRTQLQDDYSMADSLMNFAFGVGMGAGLHGAAGAVGDALGISRFARDQQQKLIDDARAQATRAAEQAGQAVPPAREAATIPAEFKQPIELASVTEAPFAKRWEVTPESAQARAHAELAPDIRAELTATAGSRLDPGQVPAITAQIADLDARLKALDEVATFKERAKAAQGQGASRKEAESIARKDIAAEKADVAATRERLQGQLDGNARAAQAEQALAELEAGITPAAYKERVTARADELMQAVAVEKAMRQSSPPAEFVIGAADQAQREGAMRAAIGQAMSGRTPSVEAFFMKPEEVAAAARTVAEQHARAESVATADFRASDAATQKLKAAPKTHDEVAAEAALTAQNDKLEGLLKNLEQRGMDPAKIKAMREALKPFDDAVADTDNLANALQAAAVCGLRA